MGKYASQRRRLIAIDRSLRSGTYPNCRRLAEELEVHPRTILRDIDFLRDTEGAPVAYNPERRGYAYTEPTYSLPVLDISESDLFAICIAEQALAQYEGTPLHERLEHVFERIQAALPGQVTLNPAWIGARISFKDGPQRQLRPEIWDTVARGLTRGRRLLLRHRSPDRARSTVRRVDPYHLLHHQGDWYLLGHCHKAGDVRIFAVSRISHAELLDHPVRVPDDFDALDLFERNFGIIWSDRSYRVRLRFDRRAAPYIRERVWRKDQTLSPGRDGSLDMAFTTSHLDELTTWILSWGEHVRVLAPAELRTRVRDTLSSALRQYAS